MNSGDPLLAFSARLNELCDDKNVPPKGKNRQTTVAKLFGVSQNAVRKWLEAEGYPSNDMARRIAIWGEVHYEWLTTGRGPKKLGDLYPSPAIAQVAQTMQTMTAEQQAMAARLIKQINPNTQGEGNHDGKDPPR